MTILYHSGLVLLKNERPVLIDDLSRRSAFAMKTVNELYISNGVCTLFQETLLLLRTALLKRWL